MALLYADGTAKGQAEELVKIAVWSLVDTVRAVKGFTHGMPWTKLAKPFRKQIALWRNDNSRIGLISDETSSSSTSAATSSRRSTTPPIPTSPTSVDATSDASSECGFPEFLQFAVGAAATDKIHVLTAENGLPNCARPMKVPDDGWGIGLAAAKRLDRPLCLHCAKRTGATLD